jgi:alkylation response protein AidB-like acyl-CoA dehydrogenase
MDFELSDEQKLLADTVGRFAERSYDFEKRRAVHRSETGTSRAVWDELAGMGLAAINVPAEYGGLGAGGVETMLAMSAFGRCLLLEPFLASAVTATVAIAALADEAPKAELLPALAEGTCLAVFAHEESGMRTEFLKVRTMARPEAGGYVLDGAKSVVAHAGAADLLIVSASLPGGELALFRVDAGMPGLAVRSYRTLDGQAAGEVVLSGLKLGAGHRLTRSGAEATAAIGAAIDATLAALCAEGAGAMQELNRLTGEYLRTRKQFGQPLAAFQVLRHRYAEMLTEAEQAQSMAVLAALSLSAAPAERSAARQPGCRADARRHGRHRRDGRQPLLPPADRDRHRLGRRRCPARAFHRRRCELSGGVSAGRCGGIDLMPVKAKRQAGEGWWQIVEISP